MGREHGVKNATLWISSCLSTTSRVTALVMPPAKGQRTPMMQQWYEAKSAYPDALLFFRMGDFYELFDQDAVEAARLLELTLTSRDKNKEGGMPMAGVPHHALPGYLQRLIDLGHKVAVCDQMEDPKQAKGIVKRAVTRVVTPGVVIDDLALEPSRNNFLCAVWPGLAGYAVSYADVTTGEFRATLAPDLSELNAELGRIEPSEVLLPPGVEEDVLATIRRFKGMVTEVRVADFDAKSALSRQNKVSKDLARSVGAIASYLSKTRPYAEIQLNPLEQYELQDYVAMEESTFRNLEVVKTLVGGRRKGSLLGLLDRTVTAMGARQLRRWLQHPLRNRESVEERLDAVEELVADAVVRDGLREQLGQIYDIERLGGRVVVGLASPKDLANLRNSFARLNDLLESLKSLNANRLQQLSETMDPLTDLHAQLAKVLVEEPAGSAADGRIIAPGFSADLDEFCSLAESGKDWILEFEGKERERTGISSLKVKYNRVFGYFIEVTRANLHLVPEAYIRKQTIANGERYYTVELKEYETRVLSAEEKRVTLETQLFESLRTDLQSQAHRILRTASRVADLDALLSLAEIAHRFDYVRPVLTDDNQLCLKNSRHPVVEHAVGSSEQFVPNDVELGGDSGIVHLITGPNMAGKSTVMRQVALSVLMAQVGSFVPASEATIGVVDRIFTRVGATDDLSRGQSTFMVEMSETAHILRHATAQSLIILDEIGRGTSTFDGLSIAWSVAEHIHDSIRARTLFATHYHELTELARSKTDVRNFHVSVREWNDEIVFLRRLQEGATNRSYGIQVGRLAGLPEIVLSRAREVLAQLEQNDVGPERIEPDLPRAGQVQLGLFGPPPEPSISSDLERALGRVDINRITPLDALQLIARWQNKLK